MGERLLRDSMAVLSRWLRRLFRRTARVQAGERVIDMGSVITELTPNTSQFTTMLMKLGSASSEGSSLGGYRDPRLWDDWRWTSEWEERRREAVAHFEKQMRPEPVINWLEDELLPRVGRVLRGDGQFLRAGDIVRVVGSGR